MLSNDEIKNIILVDLLTNEQHNLSDVEIDDICDRYKAGCDWNEVFGTLKDENKRRKLVDLFILLEESGGE